MRGVIQRHAERTDVVLEIRHRVFIAEQGVPEAADLDGTDGGCVHPVFVEDGVPVATLRSKVAGKTPRIARVATLPEARGRGHAGSLMRAVMAEAAKHGLKQARLSAQADVIPRSERFGFVASGAVYFDAGLPHRDMSAGL